MRERQCQILMERFEVGELFFGVSAQMNLFAQNRAHGIVLDIGHNFTHCVPILEGNVLHHHVKRMDIGGSDVTEELMRTLEGADGRVHIFSKIYHWKPGIE